MEVTKEYVERKVEEYNRLIFDGKLPPIRIRITNVKSYLGLCSFSIRRKADGTREKHNFRLSFNKRFDLSEDDIADIIVHEMIHYYIDYNNIKDTSTHGTVFRRMMNDINTRFNRNIYIKHDHSQKEWKEIAPARERERIIAILTFSNGKTAIKVLPNKKDTITRYYTLVLKNAEIATVDIYTSTNSFFNRYPCSGAIRAHFIETEMLREQLSAAKHCLHIDRTTLTHLNNI